MGYMLVATEVTKNQSIGTLIRCACAFGAKEVLIIGSSSYSTYGAHGAQKYMAVRHFYSWQEAIDYVKGTCQCQVIGISTSVSAISSSQPITTVEYEPNLNVCFIASNSNRAGLSIEVIYKCDKIVHIPFPNIAQESCVHVDSKISICLQHFSSSASFQSTPFQGGKYETIMSNHVNNCQRDTRSCNGAKNKIPARNEFALDDNAMDMFSLFSDTAEEECC